MDDPKVALVGLVPRVIWCISLSDMKDFSVF
jgi:hypothetical protein